MELFMDNLSQWINYRQGRDNTLKNRNITKIDIQLIKIKSHNNPYFFTLLYSRTRLIREFLMAL